jgi:co-chaperonin GroES (HSP10)
LIQPRQDRVVIERIEEPQGPITLTDAPKGIRGKVLAVGPGRWHEGEWWLIKGRWVWLWGWRQPMTVQPGDEVLFSSKWNDLALDRFDDLPIGTDPNIHLLQEADVLAILG